MKKLLPVILFLIFAFLSAFGCRRDKSLVNLSHAPVSVKPDDYPRLLKRWTRKKKIIQKFDTTLDVTAVLLSWEFRWAYTVKMNHFYKIGPTGFKKLWAKQESDLNKRIQFLVSVACTDNKWNDLDKGTPEVPGPGKKLKGSMWRITLKVDNKSPIIPSNITAIEPIRRIHHNFFPFIGYFHRLYVISFPRTVNGTPVLPVSARKITLQFSGPLGATKLKWFTNNYHISD